MSYCDWSLTVGSTKHVFGLVEVTSWAIAGREYRTDDTDRPRMDGRYFGQDFYTAGDITIELIIRVTGGKRQDRFTEAMRIRTEFNTFWNGDEIRSIPGATAELEIAGIAVVDGRPRHVDWDDSLATFGIIRGSALFVRGDADAFAPGEEWNSVSVGLVPPQVGGLIAPLIAPLTTARTSTRARPFEVTSELPVWPIITVTGPLQNGGSIELTNSWIAKLNRGLAYDEVAVIDTRPGSRNMKVNGVPANVLSASGARMSELKINPGIQEVALRGTSVEGTATVQLQWRNVRNVI